MMMRRSRIRRVVERLSVEVETALWAGLAAFVIFFCAMVLPEMPAALAKAESERARDIAAENQRYCAKWGMAERTQAHQACLVDLQLLRADIEQRRADQVMF
jgi:hypothetical protein